MCWVIGQFLSVGILNGFIRRHDEWSYRIPFAIQWVCLTLSLAVGE
jgi:SP family general alpha glucoside:H+ symporter-like MFS transporter